MYVQKNKRSAIISPYKQKVVFTHLLVTMSLDNLIWQLTRGPAGYPWAATGVEEL